MTRCATSGNDKCYSITSSARVRTVSEILNPRALAALRLMMRSNGWPRRCIALTTRLLAGCAPGSFVYVANHYAESFFRNVFLAAFGSARFASSNPENKFLRWISLSVERLVSARQRRYPSKIKVDVHAIIIPKRIACIVLIVPPPYCAFTNLLSTSPHAHRAIVVSISQQRDHYMDRVGHRSPRGSVATLLCVNDVFEDEV
jgi:hypothetical protein